MSPARATLLLAALPALLGAQALPTGESILDRNVEARGGKAAFASKKTLVMKGTLEMGIRGALVLPRAETKLAPAESEFRGVGRPPERYEEDPAGPSRAIHEPLVKRSQDVTIVGLKGTLTISRAEPDFHLTELETPKLGRLVEGFDGTVA